MKIARDRMMLPAIHDLTRYAVFLDFDGTLVDIADRPGAVRIDTSVLRCIEAISWKVEHALAVVSGREIAVIDRFMDPLVIPVAGVHGLERRDSAGIVHRAAMNGPEFTAIGTAVERAVAAEPGLVLETKPGAIALHYRLRPDLEAWCRAIIERILHDHPDLAMLHGKMVFELKLGNADKGTAIEAFLDEPPFAGRVPIFAGDDVTDEAGFFVVNARGGISIKIGIGRTTARWRAAGIDEFRDWLDRLALTPCKGTPG
jgi:trehalose 6-phosphate phosphatase